MRYYVNDVKGFLFGFEERDARLFSRKGDYIEGKTERGFFRARRVSLLKASLPHILGAFFFLVLCVPYGLAGFLSVLIVGSALILSSLIVPRYTKAIVFLGGLLSAGLLVFVLSIPIHIALTVAVFSTSAFALLDPVLRVYFEGFEIYEILEVKKKEEEDWVKVSGYYLLRKKGGEL